MMAALGVVNMFIIPSLVVGLRLCTCNKTYALNVYIYYIFIKIFCIPIKLHQTWFLFVCFALGDIMEDTVKTKSKQNSYGNITTIIHKFTIKAYNIAMKIINHDQSEGLSTLGTNYKGLI